MRTRRDFLKISSAAAAGVVGAASVDSAAAAPAAYPVTPVVPLAKLARGGVVAFAYPDAHSPALLLRMPAGVDGGAGPDGDLVAYSTLCTHKGCTVLYKPERKMLICPCHWSVFDPAKAGALVIGQASQSLPRIDLRIQGGVVHAVGVRGLIYGRHTNIV